MPGGTGLLLGPAAAGVVWWRSHSWESAAVRARRDRLAAELPHLVDLVVACLASGADPAEALARVVPVVPGDVADEIRPWVLRLRMGSDPVTVWEAMSRHPQLGRLGATLRRSAESGAPVGPALERLADDLLARGRTAVETRVRQVEVRATVPLGLCLLPAFVLLGVVPLVAGSALGFLAVR